MTEIIEMPLDPEIQKVQDEWAIGEYQRKYDAVASERQNAYQKISDPLFMQYQRGEVDKQVWLDAVQAIKDANPYPVQES